MSGVTATEGHQPQLASGKRRFGAGRFAHLFEQGPNLRDLAGAAADQQLAIGHVGVDAWTLLGILAKQFADGQHGQLRIDHAELDDFDRLRVAPHLFDRRANRSLFPWPGKRDQVARLRVGGQPNARRLGQQRLHHLQHRFGIGRSDVIDFELQGRLGSRFGRLAKSRLVDRFQHLRHLPEPLGTSGGQQPQTDRVGGQPQRTVRRRVGAFRDLEDLTQQRDGLLRTDAAQVKPSKFLLRRITGEIGSTEHVANLPQSTAGLGDHQLPRLGQQDDFSVWPQQFFNFLLRLFGSQVLQLKTRANQFILAAAVKLFRRNARDHRRRNLIFEIDHQEHPIAKHERVALGQQDAVEDVHGLGRRVAAVVLVVERSFRRSVEDQRVARLLGEPIQNVGPGLIPKTEPQPFRLGRGRRGRRGGRCRLGAELRGKARVPGRLGAGRAGAHARTGNTEDEYYNAKTA